MDRFFTQPGIIDERFWRWNDYMLLYCEFPVGTEFEVPHSELPIKVDGLDQNGIYRGILVGPKHADNPYRLKKDQMFLLSVNRNGRYEKPEKLLPPVISEYFLWAPHEILEKIHSLKSEINPKTPLQGILIVKDWASMAVALG